MVVIQWYEDGSTAVVYPEKYATGGVRRAFVDQVTADLS